MIKLNFIHAIARKESYLYGREVNVVSCKKHCMLIHIAGKVARSRVRLNIDS